eukprot:2968696-Prorocentrum_lima.AAC.1
MSSEMLTEKCDKHAGVFLLYGHLKCNWGCTLLNAQNKCNFGKYDVDSLSRKGVYPLNSNSWWLAQPAECTVPTN